MSSRREGGQPLRHLYLFVAIEGFHEGAEIYNGVGSLMSAGTELVCKRGKTMAGGGGGNMPLLFPINGTHD